MEIKDTNCVRQLKKRNIKALEFIIDKYGNLVYSVVRKVLNKDFYKSYVEECTNDVFLSMWNNIGSFDEAKGNLKCWLAAISKYKAIDYQKKLNKQISIEWLDENKVCDEFTTENIIVSKENRKEFLAAIWELNQQDREIFIRRYFLSEDIENIARTFAVDRNVVYQRLSRGRKLLKEKLVLKGELL